MLIRLYRGFLLCMSTKNLLPQKIFQKKQGRRTFVSSVSCDVCHCVGVGVCVQEFKKIENLKKKKFKKKKFFFRKFSKVRCGRGREWTMEQWNNGITFFFRKRKKKFENKNIFFQNFYKSIFWNIFRFLWTFLSQTETQTDTVLI